MENGITINIDVTALMDTLNSIAENIKRITDCLETQDRIIKSVYGSYCSDEEDTEDYEEDEEESPVDNLEKCLTEILSAINNKNESKKDDSKSSSLGDIIALIGALV